MRSNKYKATVTLGIASVGFLASYPFNNTFLGGLLTSGFEAAVVGGLADWFAVTALFKKPLGIPFRTDLIARNRERIFSALMDMVENELLTKENIIRELTKYDFADFLIQYLEAHGGKDNIKSIIRKFGIDILELVEPSEFGHIIDEILKNNAAKIKFVPLVVQAIEWSARHGYIDKFIDFVLAEFIRLAEHPQMRSEISTILYKTKKLYERDMAGRQLVSELLNISIESMTVTTQKKLLEFLHEFKKNSNPLRNRVNSWLNDITDKLKHDTEFQGKAEVWKNDFFNNLDVTSIVAGAIAEMRRLSHNNVGGLLRLSRWFSYKFDNMVEDFKINHEQQRKVDKVLKQLINRLVDKYHHQIGLTVKSVLDKYTNEMLVEFVKTKAGNDLQMIRINGSVMGGLVGMLIFILTYWL